MRKQWKYLAIFRVLHLSNLEFTCYTEHIPKEYYTTYYQKQISSFNGTTHDILSTEILLILSKFPKVRKEKRGIITSLISSFIGLAYESISSLLHNRKHKALQKSN